MLKLHSAAALWFVNTPIGLYEIGICRHTGLLAPGVVVWFCILGLELERGARFVAISFIADETVASPIGN